MKEKYINKIKIMGKVARTVVSVAKVLVIISMVLMVLLYLFLDSWEKYITYIEVADIEWALDLRNFGFVYSEVDRAQQAEVEEFKFEQEYAEMFKDTNATGFGKLEIGGIIYSERIESIYGDDYFESRQILIDDVDTYLIVMFVCAIFVYITLVYAGNFFEALKESDSPFGEYVIKYMQGFAFSLIPWGLFGPTVQITAVEWAKKISVVVGVNFTTIFVIIVLLCLAYVFKYGALLQQESDETL